MTSRAPTATTSASTGASAASTASDEASANAGTKAPSVPLSLRLTTERLVLRAPRTSDVGALRHATRRNVEHLRPWSPKPPLGEDATSLTQISNGILSARKAWRKGEGYTFWMFDAHDEERVLGRVHLSSVRRSAFQNTYLGYWCDVDSQRRGLMTEAVRTVVGFAFELARLHRVQAAVMPRNEASLQVLAKLGFRREGFAARYLQIAGTWEDHVLLAVTREEWPVGACIASGAEAGSND